MRPASFFIISKICSYPEKNLIAKSHKREDPHDFFDGEKFQGFRPLPLLAHSSLQVLIVVCCRSVNHDVDMLAGVRKGTRGSWSSLAEAEEKRLMDLLLVPPQRHSNKHKGMTRLFIPLQCSSTHFISYRGHIHDFETSGSRVFGMVSGEMTGVAGVPKQRNFQIQSGCERNASKRGGS